MLSTDFDATAPPTDEHLAPCPEWLNAEQSIKKGVKIGLLKNGNHHQPVKLGKETVSVLNTCAIDAFCQSLSTAYCDSLSFQRAVNNESTNHLLQLVKSIATQGVSTNIYLKRAELLATLFPTGQLMSGALQIDAQCHVSTIL